MSFDGAALLADVTGYTAMTELLARAGPAGPERVRDWLDECFGRVIDLVIEHGGDVANFAGDAVIALWRGEGAAAAAAACGQAIQAISWPGVDAPRLRVGVGAGVVHLMRAGGHEGRWLLVAGGELFAQMGVAARSVPPVDAGRPLRASDAVPLAAPAPLRASPSPAGPLDAAELARWVPPLVATRIAEGQGDWLAELRTVSVVFVIVRGLDFARIDARARVQTLAETAQQVAQRYEGTVVQLLMDDNGCVVLLAFGLPGTAHADDAARATRAALELEALLAGMELPRGIGVCTGLAFCGSYGNGRRRNYAVVGDAVNFAARLAQQQSACVLSDEGTARHAQAASQIAFVPLEPLHAKGASAPRAIFRATPVSDHRSQLAVRLPAMPLVGRVPELGTIQQRLEALKENAGSHAPILIEGAPGIGKTRLCVWIAETAGALGLTLASAVGDALEMTTPYRAWRGIVATLVGASGVADEDALRNAVATAGELPDYPGWWPLLGPILQVEIPDSETTRQMSGRVRGDATRQLLSALVRRKGSQRPDVLLFDDAQWLDASSWELITELCTAGDAPLIVVAMRPMERGLPTTFAEISARTGTAHISLAPLRGQDVLALLNRELGTTAVAPEVVEFVLDKTEGNPFFVHEITRALRENGAFQFDERGCRFAESQRAIENRRLPPTLAGMVTNRLDRLTAPQLTLLKIASVIGRAFSPQALRALQADGAEASRLEQLCEGLCEDDVLVREPSEAGGERTFAFRHSIIKDVTYQLMSFAQRRVLHASTARWIERSLPGPAGYGLRAHHWRGAEDRTRLLESLELAGDHAQERGASREALELFSEALQLDSEAGADDLRRAHWHVQIGDAWYRLGDVNQSMDFLTRALALLDVPVPLSTAGWLRRGAREFAIQTAHRVRLPRRLPPPQEERRLLSAAYVWSILSELHYFATRLPEMMASLLTTANLAESARAPELAARAYSILGYMAGVGRMHGLAAFYFRLGKNGKHAHDVANTHYGEGLYEMAFARGERCFHTTRTGIAVAESVGDHFSAAIGKTILGAALQHKGQTREALAVHLEVVASARRRSNIQQEVWGLSGAAECLVELGQADEALERLREAAPLMPQADGLSAVRFEGVRAWALLRQGDHGGALRGRNATLELLRRGEQPMYAWFYALMGIAEVGIEVRDNSNTASAVRASLGVLKRYALVLPFARARLALLEGRWAARRGAFGSARASWRRALALGRRLDLPCETSVAQLELGLLASDPAATRAALQESSAMLTSSRRTSELARLERAALDVAGSSTR